MGKGKGHVPIRTCICCRAKGPKHELLRLVVDTKGQVVMDKGGNMKGRGAYICRKEECLERLLKHRKLGMIFRSNQRLTISSELKTGKIHGTE
ncbi:MAG: YlxR family protein [Deltaproteobacteria bacterium]|nr:YlxR family protein [Deltaproteobacteria bacterium]